MCGVITTIFLYMVLQCPQITLFRNPLLTGTRVEPLAPLFLPAALVLIPVVFQLTLLAIGVSLQEAADTGACQASFISLVVHILGCRLCTLMSAAAQAGRHVGSVRFALTSHSVKRVDSGHLRSL